MSLPEDRWASTSPRGWDRRLWMGTGTSLGMWKMAPCQRTLYRHRDRSSTFQPKSILRILGLVRTKNPRPWLRRRGRQSCDLQDAVFVGENRGKKIITKQSQDGPKGMAACIDTASFFLLWIEPEHCQAMRLEAERPYRFCGLIWWVMTVVVAANNSFTNRLPHWMCKMLRRGLPFFTSYSLP